MYFYRIFTNYWTDFLYKACSSSLNTIIPAAWFVRIVRGEQEFVPLTTLIVTTWVWFYTIISVILDMYRFCVIQKRHQHPITLTDWSRFRWRVSLNLKLKTNKTIVWITHHMNPQYRRNGTATRFVVAWHTEHTFSTYEKLCQLCQRACPKLLRTDWMFRDQHNRN